MGIADTACVVNRGLCSLSSSMRTRRLVCRRWTFSTASLKPSSVTSPLIRATIVTTEYGERLKRRSIVVACRLYAAVSAFRFTIACPSLSPVLPVVCLGAEAHSGPSGPIRHVESPTCPPLAPSDRTTGVRSILFAILGSTEIRRHDRRPTRARRSRRKWAASSGVRDSFLSPGPEGVSTKQSRRQSLAWRW